ncbi:unnamed protein product [Pedinophyceae sp. YPF-701]|nr:unnamed protein product [Pedinophyceae sp. YPF-701]
MGDRPLGNLFDRSWEELSAFRIDEEWYGAEDADALPTGSAAPGKHHIVPEPAPSGPGGAVVSQPGLSATCKTCGIGPESAFESTQAMRAHYRGDWHRLNAQRRGRGLAPLTEPDFEALVGAGEAGSISGSDTESESEDGDEYEDAGDLGAGDALAAASRGPRIMLRRDATAPTSLPERIFIWRCMLAPPHDDGSQALRGVARLLGAPAAAAGAPGGRPQVWAVLLARGGHFAGSLFTVGRGAGSGREAARASLAAEALGGAADCLGAQKVKVVTEVPGCACIAHKTFHRYVVRAGQGGRQGAKDATGQVASSAGSALRRANERALAENIRGHLARWRPALERADLILVQLSRADRAAVFCAETGLKLTGDPRVRRVPVATKRPTFSETKRVVHALTSIYEAPKPPAKPPAKHQPTNAPATGAPAQPQQPPAAVQDQFSNWSLAGAAQAQAVANPWMPEEPASEAEPTVPPSELHKAARAGDAELVAQLLQEGHDPTVLDSRGWTPYMVASNKPARDAFRRHMAKCPDAWDWEEAAVPSALTEEMESRQKAQKKEKEQRRRQKEQERKRAARQTAQQREERRQQVLQEEIDRAAREAYATASSQPEQFRAGNKEDAAGRPPPRRGTTAGKVGRAIILLSIGAALLLPRARQR